MTERYLEPVEVRTVPAAHLRLIIEALLRYLHVEVLADATPEATAFVIRRVRKSRR